MTRRGSNSNNVPRWITSLGREHGGGRNIEGLRQKWYFWGRNDRQEKVKAGTKVIT
jgi:hypothetical protein